MGWRDHLAHGSFKKVHRDGHAACSTPSDMSGPPTPVHTSSPLRTQERYFIHSSTKMDTARADYSRLSMASDPQALASIPDINKHPSYLDLASVMIGSLYSNELVRGRSAMDGCH